MNASLVRAHATALRQVKKYGVAVTLTSVDGMTSIAGYAMRVRGSPRVYESLKLVESSAPTLLFVPGAFIVQPESLGFAIPWAGVTYRVRSIDPIAPNGEMVSARLVVSI